jgi:DNA polymerase-3 subunit beta
MIVLKAPQQDVLAALNRVLGVVERRHTLPILANVALRQTAGAIEFTATDLELQLRTRADLGGDAGSFAITVAARKLADILRAMPSGQLVTLSAQRNRLTLQGGTSRFTLQTLPSDDFPTVPEAADLGVPFAVPRAVLKGLLDDVAFAMAAHDIRYFLNGVLLVADAGTLTLVATDGNRLALARAAVPDIGARHELILPRKTVGELQRLLREAPADDAPVRLRVGAAQVRFELDGIEVVSKLIEGRYPDWRRVIPVGHRLRVTLGRAALLAALQRAAILTSERFRSARLTLAPGLLRVAASNAEQEEAVEEIDIDHAGEGLEIGLNITYLTEMLAQTHAERVQLELDSPTSSVLFSFPHERPGFQYVVSPMRL